MSINGILRLSVLLGAGIFVGCSSSENENQKSSQVNNQTSSSVGQSNIEGSRVYIDPETGQYTNTPPKNTNAIIGTNNSISKKTDSNIKYTAPKDSNVPGVGVYMELEGSQSKGK